MDKRTRDMPCRLTVAQHNRLDRITIEDSCAVVIGWKDGVGPLVMRSDGRVQAINPQGRAFGQKRFMATES